MWLIDRAPLAVLRTRYILLVETVRVESLPPRQLRRSLLAVLLGGAVGSLLRVEIMRLSLNWSDGWVGYAPLSHHYLASWPSLIPWWLLLINTAGVLLAAWLLCGRLHARPPSDWWRLFLITGVLGGLTSYSALIRAVWLIGYFSVAGAALVLISALVVGLGAAWCGVRLARR